MYFLPFKGTSTYSLFLRSLAYIFLVTLSAPIIGPIADQLGYSVETTVMTLVAANGLVNLITPTCGAIMGGLALAKVEYTTWFRWAFKVVVTIAVVNILILTTLMIFL